MRIIGLDVGANSVFACCAEELPQHLKRYLNSHKQDIVRLSANRQGLDKLLALRPDLVVMEPTGVHYAEFWHRALTHHRIEVRWVGHVQARNYRKSHQLPSKNDKADALALACYGQLHATEPEFFLSISIEPADRLRRLCLQLEHLTRLLSPSINVARQYLAHEFPEAALMKTSKKSLTIAPLWGWLAGERPSRYYDRLRARSVALDLGLEISEFTGLGKLP